MAFVIADLWAISAQVADGFLSSGGGDDRCCSSIAVPWRLIFSLVLSAGIAGGLTFQITAKITADTLEFGAKTRLNTSITTIVDEVHKVLEHALLATGDAKAGEAVKLHKAVIFYLGPLLGFMSALGPAVKALDDAAKGEVAQELVCTGFNCDKRHAGGGGGTTPPLPPGPATPPASPSASASAAGGAASAAAAAGGQTIIITGGHGGGGNGQDTGSNSGMPQRRIPCDCGKGKLNDYVAPGKPTEKRRMTDKEKSDAARAAIEQFADVWNKDNVTKQLHAIVTALTTVEPKKKKKKKTSVVNIFAENVNFPDQDHGR